MDVPERGGTVDHGGGDPVDVGGTRVAPGVEQGAEGLGLGTVLLYHHHGDLDDPLAGGGEPGGLDVDDREARAHRVIRSTDLNLGRRCDGAADTRR